FNGDGQLATLATVCNPGQAIEVPGSGGDVLIADQSFHRIRKIEGATGVIRTLVGTGPAGFSGDGAPGSGGPITGTATGLHSNDAQAGVLATNLVFSGLEVSRNTLSPPDAFTVFLQTPGVGNLRSASPLTIQLATSSPGVEAFSPGNTATASVAIANNVNGSS